jgi:SAM-dependent methyltransferase
MAASANPYDDSFFTFVDRTAAAAAAGMIPGLAGELKPRSVLDVGCGRAVWLAHWLRHGADEVLGIDGSYVDPGRLAVPRTCFLAHDLAQSFSLGRQFDLVQSLEVAEHIPATAADVFIDNLVRHGRVILFSAAIPGQGGEHHVNEQPWEYWRAKFATRGFETFDFLRPRIRDERAIEFFYRFNIFLYVHSSVVAALPASIKASRVEHGQPLANELPLTVRLRLLAVSCLPRYAVDRVARMRYRLLARLGRPSRAPFKNFDAR